MAFFDNLRAAIAAVVRPNGRRAITGANLQATLFTMIDGMGQGMQYLGIATPDTIPGTPDFPAYYLAGFNADDTHGAWAPEAFGMDQEVSPGAILRWTGSEWVEVANPLGRLQDVYVYELDIDIRAKYTKPASGIPYSDMSAAVQDALDAGSRAEEGVTELRTLVPTQASAQNQLADKNFVNSSIQTETAHFRGNYESVADLPLTGAGYGGTPTNNDYMVIQDTTGKLTHEPSPLYDETGAYVAGEIRIAYDGYGNTNFYLCLADNDYDDPKPPATSPTYWEWLEDWGNVSGGTWRFKYSGVWSVNGVKGWRPEYQVNEEPLTAAQVAALNSNITEALTNKLVALPSKPVDTAAQTLTEAEKAQARTNIGATAPEVFMATYGTTTYAEIISAYNAGKVVLAKRTSGKDNYVYSLAYMSSTEAAFMCLQFSTNNFISVSNADTWVSETVTLERSTNKVTSLSASSTDNQYPSAKCVYDNLYKTGVISQTQNWAKDYGSYTLSDIVRGNIPAYFINLWNAAVMHYGTFNEATGYFELNGLTDLSYEDALRIYNIKQPGARAAQEVKEWVGPNNSAFQNYPIFKIRTIIPCVLSGTDVPRLTWNIWIEVSRFIMPRDSAPIFGNIVGYTYGQHRLKRMLDTYKVESAYTLTQFYALEECYFIISANVTASDSKYLSLASVVYMVENAKNNSAITITLHANAYARCVADTTEYTYQGNTYTGIVAYANAKQITIASA